MEEKIKRKTVYVSSPYSFEMGPCECGNEHTQWSEYENHLWCEKCEIDFIPKDSGLFSSPIPIQTAQLLGLDFSRFNLESQKMEVFDSDYYFTEFQMIDDIMKTKKMAVIIKSMNNEVTSKADLILENNELVVIMNSLLKEKLFIDSHEKFKIEIIADDIKINKLNFQLVKENDELNFIKDQNYLYFVKYILHKILETMEIKNQTIPKHKV